jgi:hypothetical protein
MTGTGLRARLRRQDGRLLSASEGQALIETVMATGFLVAIAIALNKMLAPVVLEAFEKISKALSAVGP